MGVVLCDPLLAHMLPQIPEHTEKGDTLHDVGAADILQLHRILYRLQIVHDIESLHNHTRFRNGGRHKVISPARIHIHPGSRRYLPKLLHQSLYRVYCITVCNKLFLKRFGYHLYFTK